RRPAGIAGDRADRLPAPPSTRSGRAARPWRRRPPSRWRPWSRRARPRRRGCARTRRGHVRERGEAGSHCRWYWCAMTGHPVTIPAGRYITMSTRTAAQPTILAPARAGWRGWAGLAVLMLPALLVSVDNTVLSFALPQIALELEPTSAEQLWIIDAYPLVLAALLVTMGMLGDRFGRRRMLLVGATGFALVSVLAAFAPTAGVLIGARALLGVFGAMLMPSTLSLLRTVFPDRDQR